MTDDQQRTPDNRSKKMVGRAKRRRYVQGTRAWTHAMVNSMAKRTKWPPKPPDTDAENPL